MGKFTRITAATASVALLASAYATPAFAADADSRSIGGGSGAVEDWARIAGKTRYTTSIEAAKQQLRDGNVRTGGTVYIAGGEAFPDSLAVTTLADCNDSPVLLTPKTGLDSAVVNFVKNDLRPSKVVVIGGSLQVYAGFEDAFANATGLARTQVQRVSGETRYETAYRVAAETLTCNGWVVGEELEAAKSALLDAQLREKAYQDALRAYEAARDNYAAKLAALDAAKAERAALEAKLAELVKQIKPTVDTKPILDKLIPLQTAQGELNAHIAADTERQMVLSDLLGAHAPQGDTTLDINSTLDEYIAHPDVDDVLAAKIREAADHFGVETSDTLNTALAAAKAHTDALRADQATNAREIARLTSELLTAIANDADNAEVRKKMAAIYEKIKEVDARIGDADTPGTLAYEYAKALAALEDATDKLAAATTNRPKPGEIARLTRAVAAAYDAVVDSPGAAAHPIFLATGLSSNNALAAGPAAAEQDGVVLLTNGSSMDAWTQKYINASTAQTVAVGAPASAAIGANATKKFASTDDYQVAADVAAYYFNNKGEPVAIASGEEFADAVIASSFIANYDGTLLLTKKADLTKPTFDYLAYSLDSDFSTQLRVFGGPMWISSALFDQIEEAASL